MVPLIAEVKTLGSVVWFSDTSGSFSFSVYCFDSHSSGLMDYRFAVVLEPGI